MKMVTLFKILIYKSFHFSGRLLSSLFYFIYFNCKKHYYDLSDVMRILVCSFIFFE